MPKLMFLAKVTLIGVFFPEIFSVGMYMVEREGASIQDTYFGWQLGYIFQWAY